MKSKYFLLIIPAAVISSALIAFLLLYLIIVIVLYITPWDVTGPRTFLFGTEYKDDYVNATAISADFTDKVSINGNEISAPQDNLYMIVEMEIAAIDGNWNVISDFTVSGNGLVNANFDREITSRLNGCDLLKLNSSEKQSVSLVFPVPESEQSTGCLLTVQYTDGCCSEPFILSSWQKETVQA